MRFLSRFPKEEMTPKIELVQALLMEQAWWELVNSETEAYLGYRLEIEGEIWRSVSVPQARRKEKAAEIARDLLVRSTHHSESDRQ